MMKEGGVSHPSNEFHPYANGNMQHMYNNSRQTPDSGLGNEELRNSMNNAGGGGDNAAPAGGGAPPGFQPNPFFMGNPQQSQYNDQQQFRQKQYSGGQEGGRFERSSGPPSIVTMHTSPPNMDQEGAQSYNPNYGNYPQYGNQGGPPYGGMDRNFNAPHPMTARSHSNYSESSSSTLNMAAGGPPDASMLSGQPLMAAGPHAGMMYPGGGPPMGVPYGHPQMQPQHMQQGGGPYMFNPAAAHAAAMANQQGGQMAQQQGGPQGMQHPQGIPMQPQQGGGGTMPPGPPQSASPPHPGMMMMPMGPNGAPLHPGQTVYYQQHPAMMAGRGPGPIVGQGPDGFVQFTYPHPHAAAAVAAQQQGGYPMRGPLLQQRSLNSPAPSDNTDGQSVQGGGSSIGMWNGPPEQQSQQNSPPGGMQPMQPMQHGQMMPMQPGMMPIPQHQMMTASYPGAGGVPFGGPGPRMVNPAMMNAPYSPHQMQQMALHHAMMQTQQQQQQGMQHMQQHPQQMQQQYNAGGFPPQQQSQPQSGYWQGPPGPGQGARGGYRGSRGGRGNYGGGNRPGSRQQYNSRNNSIASGGRGRETEENSKCTTPTEDDLIADVSQQMDSLRMGEQSMEGAQTSHTTLPQKQLLELAGEHDTKSTSPPAEPHPSEEVIVVPQETQQEGGAAAAAAPTTPRSEPRKELLEMKKTPKHQQTEKGSSQSIPVDPVPHGTTASTGRKWSEVAAKMSCVYCRGKDRPVEEYSTHNLRDAAGLVSCPLFRAKGCTFCGEKGDYAHDAFFCKKRHEQAASEHTGAVGHTTQAPHAEHHGQPTHHGEREGGYRGGSKRGGGHYRGRGGGHGGGHGKYENRNRGQ